MDGGPSRKGHGPGRGSSLRGDRSGRRETRHKLHGLGPDVDHLAIDPGGQHQAAGGVKALGGAVDHELAVAGEHQHDPGTFDGLEVEACVDLEDFHPELERRKTQSPMRRGEALPPFGVEAGQGGVVDDMHGLGD